MFSKKKQLTADDMPWSLRARFYEEAINQMPSGVDISQVLENLKKSLLRRGRRKQALMIYDLSQRLHGGSSIVNALGSSVEGMERSILVAGEKVGAIVEAMERALALHARMSAMRAQVWSRMFAPAVYFVSIYMTSYVIGTSVVGPFAEMVPINRWTGWARVLYLMGWMSTSWFGPVFIGMIVALVCALIRVLPRWVGKGRAFCDQYVTPFTLYCGVQGYVWMLEYATLVRAGVADTDTIAAQAMNAQPWLASRLRPIFEALIGGRTFTESLEVAGQGFPSFDLIDKMKSFAVAADIPDKIEAAADAYIQQIQRSFIFQIGVMTAISTGFTFLGFTAVQLGGNSITSMMATSTGW